MDIESIICSVFISNKMIESVTHLKCSNDGNQDRSLFHSDQTVV